MVFKLKLFSKTLILFILTQVLAFYIALKILPDVGAYPVQNISSFTFADLIYILVAAALFFFFAFKFPRFGSGLYKVFLSIIIFSMIETVLMIWLKPEIALIGAAAILIWFWFWRNVFTHDFIMIVTLAGLAAILGLSLTPIFVVYALVILSFYDIIAVYKTGHMVKMASMMVASRAIFGFIIPGTVSDFKTDIKTVQPGEQFMILGSGDIALPIIFSISLLGVSIVQSLIVAAFSILGLFATHLIFNNQKTRRPMAALPPIAAMAIIGYLISIFIK